MGKPDLLISLCCMVCMYPVVQPAVYAADISPAKAETEKTVSIRGMPAELALAANVAGEEFLELAAQTWAHDKYIALLDDAHDMRRRGAARILAAAKLPLADLVFLAVAQKDTELPRLLLSRVHADELAVFPVSDVLQLKNPTLICMVWSRYPAQHALFTKKNLPLMQKTLRRWLSDPASCIPAAQCIAGRGTVSDWAPLLIEVLAKAKDQTVIHACNDALQILCGVQRALAPYAGHVDMLAEDWQDTLAEQRRVQPEHPQADHIRALLERLPAKDALLEVLPFGPQALPILEELMAHRGRARRQELSSAARLLNRWISPLLYAHAADVLTTMDADEYQQRSQALHSAVESVRSHKDAQGLMHILTYSDDADARVRTRCFDFLTRLADNEDDFTKEWELGDADALFNEQATAWRIRRSLRNRGSAASRGQQEAQNDDECIAVLQFIGTLKADVFKNDLHDILISRSSVVQDTVLDVFAQLDMEAEDARILMRVVIDPLESATRRARILNILADKYSSIATGLEMKQVRELVGVSDRLISRAALELLAASSKYADDADTDLLSLFTKNLTAGKDRFQQTLELIQQREKPAEAALLIPYITSPDKDVRISVSRALWSMRDEKTVRARIFTELSRKAAIQHIDIPDAPGSASPTVWQDISEQLTADDASYAYMHALAFVCGLENYQQWSAAYTQYTASERQYMLMALAQRAGTDAQMLEQLMQRTAELQTAQDLDEQVLSSILSTLYAAIGHQEHLLLQLLAMDKIRAFIPYRSSSTSGNMRSIQRRSDNKKIIFQKKGTQWTLSPAAQKMTVSQQQVDAIITFLGTLQLSDQQKQKYQLVMAVCQRQYDLSDKLLQDTWRSYSDLWYVLSQQQKEELHKQGQKEGSPKEKTIRERLLAQMATHKGLHRWDIEDFLIDGQADMLPIVIGLLQAEESSYTVRKYVKYLKTLSDADLQQHLSLLVTSQHTSLHSLINRLLKAKKELPIELVLVLLQTGHNFTTQSIQSYTDEVSAQSVGVFINELPAKKIVRLAKYLRMLRNANTQIFDQQLSPLLAAGDRRSAAWLRTGIPLQAGMKDAYVQALNSQQADMWMVGAAFALKQGTMTLGEFLPAIPALPTDIQIQAVAVAKRYGAKVLPEKSIQSAVRHILSQASRKSLLYWLALAEPDTELAEVLSRRVSDQNIARGLAPQLAKRLQTNAQVWLPLVRRIASAAHGQLDYILIAYPLEDLGEKKPKEGQIEDKTKNIE